MRLELVIDGKVIVNEPVYLKSELPNRISALRRTGYETAKEYWEVVLIMPSSMNQYQPAKSIFNSKEAWDLRNNGWSLSALAVRYNITYGAICNRLSEYKKEIKHKTIITSSSKHHL